MIYYEVWGWDTFSNESYFCGRFTSRKEAEKKCRQCEKEVRRTQSADLRDTFSIAEVTEDEISERERRTDQIREEKARDRMYSEKHLAGCLARVLKLFKQSWEILNVAEWKKKEEEDRKIESRVDWQDERDCFSSVWFRSYLFDGDRLVIGIGLSIHSRDREWCGDISSTCSFRGTFDEMLRWADTEEALIDCVDKAKELIRDFWED